MKETVRNLSILIPTVGRPGLTPLLRQLSSQLVGGDEVMVIGDGKQDAARAQVEQIGDERVVYLEYADGPCRDWGNTVRNWAIPQAKAGHLMFMDDDDQVLPGALDRVRQAVSKSVRSLQLFRMYHSNVLLWADQSVRVGNVSTQMIVVPKDVAEATRWPQNTYEGDYWFIRGCSEKTSVVWRDEVIAIHGIAPKSKSTSGKMKRNLLYNCCPFSWSDEWQLNIAKLNQYAEVFNGRRLVLVRQPVANGPAMASIDEVRDAFAFDVEIEVMPNSAALWEVPGFIGAIGSLVSEDPNEATFYAHTKGVRYHGHGSERKLEGIRTWRDIMYERLLGDIGAVEKALEDHACVGAFRRMIKPEERQYGWGDWYYSGNFWWVKHSELFADDIRWRSVRQTTNGVEAYLGDMFSVEQSACIWEDNITYTPYERFIPPNLSSLVRRSLERKRLEKANVR